MCYRRYERCGLIALPRFEGRYEAAEVARVELAERVQKQKMALHLQQEQQVRRFSGFSGSS